MASQEVTAATNTMQPSHSGVGHQRPAWRCGRAREARSAAMATTAMDVAGIPCGARPVASNAQDRFFRNTQDAHNAINIFQALFSGDIAISGGHGCDLDFRAVEEKCQGKRIVYAGIGIN